MLTDKQVGQLLKQLRAMDSAELDHVRRLVGGVYQEKQVSLVGDFAPRDQVEFKDRHGEPAKAKVLYCNPSTVTILDNHGRKWTLSPGRLTKTD